jgi:protein-L-isoaspartate(D-aspartate) O-methyltransferase
MSRKVFHSLWLLLLSGLGLGGIPAAQSEDVLALERQRMVAQQLKGRDITDSRVLAAMCAVPRHRFVPDYLTPLAYSDQPLPIGSGQTISQPYIVALMTELLAVEPDDRVLEIGTGSGYQAAVLSPLVAEVYSIEIKQPLHERAAATLAELGFENVITRHGDGYYGWQEAAPFDGIIITAAVDHVPPPLLQQIADGGRIVLPLGHPFSLQYLVVVTKQGDDYRVRQISGVRFVPMTGKALDSYR